VAGPGLARPGKAWARMRKTGEGHDAVSCPFTTTESDNMIDTNEKIKRDAIWIDLVKKILADKKRDDTITIVECAPLLNGCTFDSFRQRIRRHFSHKGVALIAMPNVGYRLATAEEQLHPVADKHQRSAIRQQGVAVRHIYTTPESDLGATDKAYRQSAGERLTATLMRQKDDEAQTKEIAGTNVKVDYPRLKK